MAIIFEDTFGGSGSLSGRQSDNSLWWTDDYAGEPETAGSIYGGSLKNVAPRSSVFGETQDAFHTADGYTVTAGVYITPPIGPDPAPDPEEDPDEGGGASLKLTIGRRLTNEWVSSSLRVEQYGGSFIAVYAPGLPYKQIPISAVGVGYHILRVTIRSDGSFVTYLDGAVIHDSPGRGVGVLDYAKMSVVGGEARYGLSFAIDSIQLTDEGHTPQQVDMWWRNVRNAVEAP